MHINVNEYLPLLKVISGKKIPLKKKKKKEDNLERFFCIGKLGVKVFSNSCVCFDNISRSVFTFTCLNEDMGSPCLHIFKT